MHVKTMAVVLGLAAIAFLAGGCEDTKKVSQLESQVVELNQLLLQKDAKIKTLSDQAQINKNTLDSVKKELDRTKKELDNFVSNLSPKQKLTTK